MFTEVNSFGDTTLLENNAYLPLGFLAESELADVYFYDENKIMSLVVNIVMNVIYPAEDVTTWGQLIDYYDLLYGLNRLSPYYLYSEAISTIMDPTVRSTNIILPQQMSGSLSSYLSLGQSLLLVWPHLVALLAALAGVWVLILAYLAAKVLGRKSRKKAISKGHRS